MVIQRTWVAVSALVLASCVGDGLAPSVWPPPNFLLVVDELRADPNGVHVVRRLHVDASGVVVYGTSERPLLDEETGASLPVLDRLSVYRLEPTSARALARKLDRFGIGELTLPVRPDGGASGPSLKLTWQAFDQRRVLTTSGRLRDRVGDIMALVAAHLPPGEAWDTEMSRPVVPVLRGAPAPTTDAAGALSALRVQLETRPEDPVLLESAFALACRTGERALAEELLERWLAAARGEIGDSGFATDPNGALERRAASMRRLLPG